MRKFVPYLLFTVVATTMLGCAPCEECGSLRRQHDITNLFLNSEIIPGYNYYYNGREQWPSAIMGIDPNYTVQADFWKPVGLEGEELSEWLRRTSIWREPRETSLNGAEILDPDGKRVGVFFSRFDNLITKFQPDNVIQVFPPSFLAGEGMGRHRRGRD